MWPSGVRRGLSSSAGFLGRANALIQSLAIMPAPSANIRRCCGLRLEVHLLRGPPLNPRPPAGSGSSCPLGAGGTMSALWVSLHGWWCGSWPQPPLCFPTTPALHWMVASCWLCFSVGLADSQGFAQGCR